MKQSVTNKTNLSRKKKRLFIVITCVGTLLICLSILEIAVRIISPQSDLRRRDLLFRYEPFIGAEGIPNKKGIFANTSFKTTIALNNEGFRDYNHDKKNRQDKFRIIALGDSFTWGHGVEDDEIYMKVLEKNDTIIETINMGGSGGDPPTALKAYMSRGLHYEHNVVLHGFFMGNDIVAYYPKSDDSPPQWGFDSKGNFKLIGKMKSPEEVDRIRRESEERYSPTKKRNLRSRIHYWFTCHFQLLTFIENYRDYYSNVIQGSVLYTRIKNLFGIQSKRVYGPFLDYCMERDPENVEYGWKLLAATLETMKAYANRAGAKLYVVFIPQIVQTSQSLYDSTVRKYGYEPAEFDVEKPNRKLTKLCKKLGIDYLDLLPVMREETSNGKQLYYIRDTHWNAEGHRIAAREIYKDIKNRGWIK